MKIHLKLIEDIQKQKQEDTTKEEKTDVIEYINKSSLSIIAAAQFQPHLVIFTNSPT